MATGTQYWYGYPPWAMWGPERIPFTAPLQTKSGVTPVQHISKVQNVVRWNMEDSASSHRRMRHVRSASTPNQLVTPHLGQNIDQYV